MYEKALWALVVTMMLEAVPVREIFIRKRMQGFHRWARAHCFFLFCFVFYYNFNSLEFGQTGVVPLVF